MPILSSLKPLAHAETHSIEGKDPIIIAQNGVNWAISEFYVNRPGNRYGSGSLSYDHDPNTKSEYILSNDDNSGDPYRLRESMEDLEDYTNANGMITWTSSGKPFARINDVRLFFKFKLDTTSNLRTYLGFANYTYLDEMDFIFPDNAGNDWLNNKKGIANYNTSDNGNFRIGYNEGTGATNFTSALDTLDTDWHTLYIEADETNSRWGYSFDKSNMSWISSSEVPDSTDRLALISWIESTENVNKAFYISYIRTAMKMGITI